MCSKNVGKRRNGMAYVYIKRASCQEKLSLAVFRVSASYMLSTMTKEKLGCIKKMSHKFIKSMPLPLKRVWNL